MAASGGLAIATILAVAYGCGGGGGGGSSPNPDLPLVGKSVSASVGVGGSISLPSVASFVFPNGAGTSTQQVTMQTTATPAVNAVVVAGGSDTSSPIQARSLYEIHLNTGTSNMDALTATATVQLAPSLVGLVGRGSNPEVMVRNVWNDGTEQIDAFETVPSTYTASSRQLTFTISGDFFDSSFTTDGSWEAQLIVIARGGDKYAPSKVASNESPLDGGCPATPVGSPLGRTLSDTDFTSRFGPRIIQSGPNAGKTRLHKGVDLHAPQGTPVFAAAAGTVAIAGPNQTYGNMILVSHGSYQTRYAHLSSLGVSKGAAVASGQQIGLSGMTGQYITQPHLHFEILGPSGLVNPIGCLTTTRSDFEGSWMGTGNSNEGVQTVDNMQLDATSGQFSGTDDELTEDGTDTVVTLSGPVPSGNQAVLNETAVSSNACSGGTFTLNYAIDGNGTETLTGTIAGGDCVGGTIAYTKTMRVIHVRTNPGAKSSKKGLGPFSKKE
jgi:murein DD-endopeptidase MepM/ murein hydrolase activator NlpD